jgi:hypothetical protein
MISAMLHGSHFSCVLFGFIYIVTCFESHVSDVAFPEQPIWKLLGNRLFEAHIRCNAHVTEKELLEMDISYAVFTELFKLKSYNKI